MDSESPLVSVIIPFYNRERFLERAISSILQQTYKNIEILLINDGSNDKSEEIARSFEDSRIKNHQMPINAGISNTRNVGLRLARGELIAPMDSDDYAYPDRISKTVDSILDNPNVVVVGTQCVKVIGKYRIRQKHPASDDEIKANLLRSDGSAMVHSSTIMRRSFITRHRIFYPSTLRGVDHEIWLRIMLAGGDFSNIKDHEHAYYRHGENTTANPDLVSYNRKRRWEYRAKFLLAVFPRLTGFEANALSAAIEWPEQYSRKIKYVSKRAWPKILDEKRSRFGESKDTMCQYIAAKLNI
jgi:glycosyltransferase involved in cell wall biosynthesis